MGFGLVLLGTGLFVWACATLGSSYSGHIHIKDDQELVQTGPYHFIRHPAYAGYLLMAFGLGLGYASLSGVRVFFCVLMPAMIYRIQLEDQFLADDFGKHLMISAERENDYCRASGDLSGH